METFLGGVAGDGLGLALAIALLLGLRHATDPDHLTAVSTLVLSDERAAGRAGLLGLFWGLGHATTLFLFGLPLVLFQGALPDQIHRAAEVAIGVLIAVLAVRLLLRWRRGVRDRCFVRNRIRRASYPISILSAIPGRCRFCSIPNCRSCLRRGK